MAYQSLSKIEGCSGVATPLGPLPSGFRSSPGMTPRATIVFDSPSAESHPAFFAVALRISGISTFSSVSSDNGPMNL